MTARKLRAVDSEPPAAPPKSPPAKRGRPKSLKNAADSSEREMLVLLRNKLAAQIEHEDTPPHAIGRLIADFRKIDRDIREIDRRAKDDRVDAVGAEPDDGGDEWDDDEV